jgi:hypothetical protein
MESFWLATSEPPELPRSKIRSTLPAVSGRARSRATRRRKYSARDTPRSLARTALHLSFKCDLGLSHHYGSITPQHPSTDIGSQSRSRVSQSEVPRASVLARDQGSNSRRFSLSCSLWKAYEICPNSLIDLLSREKNGFASFWKIWKMAALFVQSLSCV